MLLIGLLAAVSLLILETQEGGQPGRTPAMRLDMEKMEYISGETMRVNVILESDEPTMAQVLVHGINSGYGDILYWQDNQSIGKGRTQLKVDYRVPQCSRCNGVPAGNYTIVAKATIAGETFQETRLVEIKQ